MVKNPKLALAIANVGWGMLNTMLKYKAEWAGKVYIQIDRFFPSSKLHNKCLYQIDKLPLDIRYWDCPKCGTKHIDRDINAAQNIRDEALRLLRCDPAEVSSCCGNAHQDKPWGAGLLLMEGLLVKGVDVKNPQPR